MKQKLKIRGVAMKSTARQAAETVERNMKVYGPPEKSWEEIAKVVSIYTGKDLTAADCVTVLEVMKRIREKYEHKTDNQLDRIGYVEIYERVRSDQTEEGAWWPAINASAQAKDKACQFFEVKL